MPFSSKSRIRIAISPCWFPNWWKATGITICCTTTDQKPFERCYCSMGTSESQSRLFLITCAHEGRFRAFHGRSVPMRPLNLANIEKAAHLIDPAFLHSPQYEDGTLNAALGQRVLVKVETANPIRSFKGRGADFFAHSLDPRKRVVCASAGNFGQAMAYVGRSRRIPVQVFVAHDVNPAKRERMRLLGATVTLCDGDFEVAKQNARRQAVDHPDCIFVEDGAEDAITEGAGTIGVEL